MVGVKVLEDLGVLRVVTGVGVMMPADGWWVDEQDGGINLQGKMMSVMNGYMLIKSKEHLRWKY